MATKRTTKKTAPGPEAVGSIVKRWRARDGQHAYGLRIRAYGQRFWVPLGTERQGWNDVRATDTRNEIAALVRRGVWQPPNTFKLDPHDKDPGFHEFASGWLERYRRTVKPRTAQTAESLLARHALPYLHPYTLAQIDYALLSSYVAHKLEHNDQIDQAAAVGLARRDAHGRPSRRLGPRTINMSLDVIARVLADAVKRGLITTNPAADHSLRLKVTQHKGNFLEADELLSLIDAAGTTDQPMSPNTLRRAEQARELRAQGRQWKDIAATLRVAPSTAIWLADRPQSAAQPSVRRAIIATLGCAGLRNSELCDLNIADLDFAHSVMTVNDAKTDAGIRRVNMTPWLRQQLLAYKATPARRPTRRARVPHPRRPSTRPQQHQPPGDRPSGRRRQRPTRAARRPAAPGRDHRPHPASHLHHPDARSRRSRPLRPKPGRAHRRHHDAQHLRPSAAPPRPQTTRPSFRRPHGPGRSVPRLNHRPSHHPRPHPHQSAARNPGRSQRIWPHKRRKPRTVTSSPPATTPTTISEVADLQPLRSGRYWTRTSDFLLVRQALYQLS